MQPNGVEKVTNPLADISEKEKELVKVAIEGLKSNIQKGVEFANKGTQK